MNSEMCEVEKVKEFLKNARLAFARMSPLFYFQLSSMRVTYIDKYPYLCRKCGKIVLSDAVTNNMKCECGDVAVRIGSLCISKDGLTFWKGWNDKEYGGNTVLGLKHELLHWMLQHMFRSAVIVRHLVSEGVDVGTAKYVANLAEDAKVNQILKDAGEVIPHSWITPYTIGLDGNEVRQMSIEEIIFKMLNSKGSSGKNVKESIRSVQMDGQKFIDVTESVDGEKSEVNGEVKVETVQDWSPELKEAREKGEKRFMDAVRRKVADDVMKAKVVAAGNATGNYALLVEAEVIKPEEITWYLKLYNSIRSELMKTVVQDWTRPNRRVRDYPGVKVIRKPKVYACVDISSSVYHRREVYKKFVGIILRIAQTADVYAVFWDTNHSTPIKVTNEKNLNDKISTIGISAGGGTMITCLNDLMTTARAGDFVIVLTDGVFFDPELSVQLMLKHCKALKILCWTDAQHKGFDKNVKVTTHE